MSKYKVGDKIMGISTDILGLRIVAGEVIDIKENSDPDLTRYLVIRGVKRRRDAIYEGETTEYDGWKLTQAETFYEEADRLEKKAEELRETARKTIYSKGTK